MCGFISGEKSFKYWWQIQVFQNFDLCLEGQISSLATNTFCCCCCCFIWQAHSVIIFRKYMLYAQVWIRIVYVSVILSRKKWHSMKKAANLACNSNRYASALLQHSHRILVCSKNALCILKGRYLILLVIFTTLVRSKWSCLSFLAAGVVWSHFIDLR